MISTSPDYKEEAAYIAQRRGTVGLPIDDPTMALCFSGGGLRAATIQLGVLQGLEEKDILKKADYLSSVSGGSYISSWYVSHLLPPGAQTVKSKKSLFHGGMESYHGNPAALLEQSSAWRKLHDDARLLRDIAAAEDDVRNGRERPLVEARELLKMSSPSFQARLSLPGY